MTLRPIPGAPIDAPVPDFPTGEPGPLVVPDSRFTRRPVEPAPVSVPPPTTTRRPGPVEIRDGGDLILTFRVIPEIPAINRSSMTISIAGERKADGSSPTMPHIEPTTDEAKAFLLALRDGESPVVIADGRTAVEVEFTMTEDGPTFIVSRPGPEPERISRRFNAGLDHDVEAMAAHLLADLGP